jgi:hypothetical protein
MPIRELLIFPKDIERSSMDSPTVTNLAAERMKTVGPMRRVKWMLSGSKGKELSQVQEVAIPEDILPIQFWLEIVKGKIPTAESSEISWGRQFRNGHGIVHGPPITVRDGDLLHITVREQKKITVGGKKHKIEYAVGRKIHTITAKQKDSIEKLLNEIRRAQRSITIERIRTEDGELRMTQTVAEIVGRRISPLVEIVLLYRGVERRMVATESWTQTQFTDAVKAAVGGRGDKFLARRLSGEEE